MSQKEYLLVFLIGISVLLVSIFTTNKSIKTNRIYKHTDSIQNTVNRVAKSNVYNLKFDLKSPPPYGIMYLVIDFKNTIVIGNNNGVVNEIQCDRLIEYVKWMNTYVVPLIKNLDKEVIYIPIDLDDGTSHEGLASMTYRGDNPNGKICMIPDPYSIKESFYDVAERDSYTWSQKIDRGIFIGASTGGENGQRMKYCRKFKDKESRKLVELYISDWVQGISPESDLFHKNMKITEQLKYKFLISLDGNVASWGRINWGMGSNSVVLKSKSELKLWYYELMESGTHYVEFDENNLISIVQNLLENPEKCQQIVTNANSFFKTYLTIEGQAEYWSSLINNIL